MDRYLEQARTVLEDAMRNMSEEQMSASRGEKWSAAQIVEHLSLAFGATAAAMQRNLAAGKFEGRPKTMKDSIKTFFVVNVGYIPTGRKAPEYTVPSGLPPQQALQQMHENLSAMDSAIALAERKWGNQIIGVHPILGPLKPDQWRKFHLAHARHHAKQIVAIKSAAAQKSAKAAA